jgi:hemolysin activation/secretion protein
MLGDRGWTGRSQRARTQALVAACGLAAAAAMAQTPPAVPRADDLAPRHVLPSSEGRLPDTPVPVPREVAKPDDDVRITIRRFTLDADAPPALAAALAGLTRDLVGADKGFEDLVEARARVTRFLQSELGYYLGYAYVPEQPFTDGEVRIAVLEGRLDRVILRWPEQGSPVRREVVQAYIDTLRPGSVLRVRDIERVVFLVNDLRGLRARFDVQPGSRPGTATLVITPEVEGVWSARVDVDANGSRFLGVGRLGGLVQMNSPFGRGDGVTANVMVSDTRGLAFGLLSYNTPLGNDGFKLGGSVSAVKYALDKVIFPLELNGTALTSTLYGLYPVVRARNLNLFVVGTAEHKQYDDRQDKGVAPSQKTVDTLALGVTGDFRDAALGGGVNTYDATLTTGQVRYQSVRPGGLDDAPHFTKLGFGFSRLQDLVFISPGMQDKHSGKLLAYLSVRGQLALQNLDTTEQFRLGGPEGVRAFAPGEGTGDEGLVASLEARLLPPESWFGRVSNELVLSAFLDGGYIRYRHTPSPNRVLTDPTSASYSGAGVGITWARPGEYAVRLSLSAPVSGTPRNDPRERSVRLYLQASKFFN